MPMIRLDPVIAVSAGALPAAMAQFTFLLQLSDGGRVAAQSVPGENARPIVRVRQSSFQEELGSLTIPCFRKVEIHGLPGTVNGTEQVHPPSANANEGFIHVPSRGLLLHRALQTAIDLWTISLGPAPEKL